MKYRGPIGTIEAALWFKNGDHPQDNCPDVIVSKQCAEMFPDVKEGDTFKGEGNVVRYYRHPLVDGQSKCPHCGDIMHNHGWIDETEGLKAEVHGKPVCPGDIVITYANKHYPVKQPIFHLLFTPAV